MQTETNLSELALFAAFISILLIAILAAMGVGQ